MEWYHILLIVSWPIVGLVTGFGVDLVEKPKTYSVSLKYALSLLFYALLGYILLFILICAVLFD